MAGPEKKLEVEIQSNYKSSLWRKMHRLLLQLYDFPSMIFGDIASFPNYAT